MGILDDCKRLYEVESLYDVLKVSRTASESEIKRAFRQVSLKVHPDRAGKDDKDATEKFQVLSKVSKILLDKEKRDVYDSTGSVIDDDGGNFDQDIDSWMKYWKRLFKFDANDIENFLNDYHGSELEKSDLKSIYVECEGDLDVIFEKQIGYELEEEDRLRKILDEAIANEDIPAFDAYTKETKKKRNKRKRWYEKERRDFEKMKEESGDAAAAPSSEDALVSLIRDKQAARRQQSERWLEALEQKYAPKSKKKKTQSTKAGGAGGKKKSSKS